MQSALRMLEVTKVYEHFQLDKLSFALPAGEIMGLVGVNGAGKSTIIRILMGLIQADAGDVEVLGYKVPQQQVLAKSEVGFASEDMRLYKTKDLEWHMHFVKSVFPAWDDAYARHLLKKFDLKSDQKIAGFSHGQRVKATLLLLLARRPALLILDEPTTGLDPVARSEVIDEFAEVLADENRSVLFSSHNTHDVEQLSDSITFLHDGRLLASENIESFLNSWRCVRCIGDVDISSVQQPGLVDVRRHGSLLSLKVEHFDESLLGALRSQGLDIVEVLPMNLEEIFIANVKKGRKQ